jgi:hypothetical protein
LFFLLNSFYDTYDKSEFLLEIKNMFRTNFGALIKDPRSFLDEALEQYTIGDYKKAGEIVSEAIKYVPDAFAEYYVILAKASFLRGDIESVKTFVEEANRLKKLYGLYEDLLIVDFNSIKNELKLEDNIASAVENNSKKQKVDTDKSLKEKAELDKSSATMKKSKSQKVKQIDTLDKDGYLTNLKENNIPDDIVKLFGSYKHGKQWRLETLEARCFRSL